MFWLLVKTECISQMEKNKWKNASDYETNCNLFLEEGRMWSFFSVTLLKPSSFSFSFSSLFDCNSWQTHACLSSAYSLLVAFSYVLMTPLLPLLDCYAAALDQILITLHRSLSLLCLLARFMCKEGHFSNLSITLLSFPH